MKAAQAGAERVRQQEEAKASKEASKKEKLSELSQRLKSVREQLAQAQPEADETAKALQGLVEMEDGVAERGGELDEDVKEGMVALRAEVAPVMERFMNLEAEIRSIQAEIAVLEGGGAGEAVEASVEAVEDSVEEGEKESEIPMNLKQRFDAPISPEKGQVLKALQAELESLKPTEDQLEDMRKLDSLHEEWNRLSEEFWDSNFTRDVLFDNPDVRKRMDEKIGYVGQFKTDYLPSEHDFRHAFKHGGRFEAIPAAEALRVSASKYDEWVEEDPRSAGSRHLAEEMRAMLKKLDDFASKFYNSFDSRTTQTAQLMLDREKLKEKIMVNEGLERMETQRLAKKSGMDIDELMSLPSEQRSTQYQKELNTLLEQM